MDKNRFQQEKICGAMLAIAAHLQKCGLITLQEQQKIKEAILQKYSPEISRIENHTISGTKKQGKEDF